MRLVTFTINGTTNGAATGTTNSAASANTAQANTGNSSKPRFGALVGDDQYVLDFQQMIEASEKDASGRQLAAGGGGGGGDPLAWYDLDGPQLQKARVLYDEIAVNAAGDLSRRKEVLRRSDVRLLAPVPRPGKLICIGLNYRDHAAESNMPIPTSPMVFSKFTTAVIGPEQPVILPATSEKVDYEAELAVVIGRRAKEVTKEQALNYVLGYTNLNDVSARDFQFADTQWQRGKSCDTFAPMGEFIRTADEMPDPHKLAIKLRLNGKTMQDSTTAQLIFNIPELIAFISQTITLEPGDVIATGTPPGVGFAQKPPLFLKDGDVMEVEVEGLGVLSNPVTAQKR